MDKLQPIGVLDSGVGGLSVLKCLHQMLPHEDFIYLGDTARTPYGTRPEAQIREFVEEMIAWLAKQNIKQLVIACNTLTMLGVETLQKAYPFTIIGMSKGEQLLLNASKKKKVGVLATPFTIAKETHKKAILAVDSKAQVFPLACPEFVQLIEKEKFASSELKAAIGKYAAPLKAAGIDALILSCTHFPFIREEIQKELGAGVKIIDPAAATSGDAILALKKEDLLRTAGTGKVTVCCTADLERVKRLTARMLPVEDCSFTQIELQKI